MGRYTEVRLRKEGRKKERKKEGKKERKVSDRVTMDTVITLRAESQQQIYKPN